MSLLSKARDFLPGLISFTGVNARRENLITALSAPWHSSGYALSSPAGRPTSLTMNPSISTPSQNEILPLPRLDGAPQTLEGTVRLADGRKPFKPQTVLFALEPQRGIRRHPARPGFDLETFRASIKTWVLQSGHIELPWSSVRFF